VRRSSRCSRSSSLPSTEEDQKRLRDALGDGYGSEGWWFESLRARSQRRRSEAASRSLTSRLGPQRLRTAQDRPASGSSSLTR
jgi:hypothetical protein